MNFWLHKFQWISLWILTCISFEGFLLEPYDCTSFERFFFESFTPTSFKVFLFEFDNTIFKPFIFEYLHAQVSKFFNLLLAQISKDFLKFLPFTSFKVILFCFHKFQIFFKSLYLHQYFFLDVLLKKVSKNFF